MIRLFIFLSVMSVFGFYVVSRFISFSPWSNLHVGWVFLITAFIVGLQFFAFKSGMLIPAAYADTPWLAMLVSIAGWVIYTALGVFYCLIIYMVAVDITALIWGAVAPDTALVVIKNRLFIGLIGVTLATTSIGIYQAVSGPRVVRVDVPIKNLPAAFDGYSIAQISDLHVDGLVRKPYVEKVVRITNDLKADAVALTGDFADGRAAVLKNDIAPLKDITAPKYFILGNHEYYWHPQEWISLYKSMDMKILMNSHDTIKRGDDSIVIAGVEDYSQGEERRDPKTALQGVPQNTTKILLAHQPSDYARAAAAGVNLQLSGHTHGGQFFPWNLVVRFFHKYFTGLNNHDGMWIYINPGTGFWGAPLRTFVPPEITLLTLRAEKP